MTQTHVKGQLYALLVATFAGSVVIGNVIAAKLTWITIPGFGSVAVPAGFLALGIAYLCSDFMTEFYGKEAARQAVNATIATLLLAYALVYVAIALPVAPFYDAQLAFATVLASSASITLASVIALGVAQHIDVAVFSRLKTRTSGKYLWIRNCGSTTLSQAIDTALFVGLGFGVLPLVGLGGDPITGAQLLTVMLGQYLVKLVVVAGDTLPFYVVTTAVSRYK